ncbi:MAG: phage tail tape measure protein [Methylobacter sp.]
MMNNVNNVTTRIQGGFNKIGYGAAGLWGVSSAIDSITKPAIEFESSMAAVNKVVDFASPKGFKDFGVDLLKMSRTIPIAASGLAEIAAAGGEQGIQLLDLPGFVNTVAKMSTAFDMSTSQAGESIGKLANIYRIPIPQMGALGDAINYLSNNTNSKASEIVDVLSRVGGIAGQMGITVNQTAALSAAMLSLGQPAEIAGTSINAMLLKLNTARNQSADFISALSGIGLSVNQLEKNIQAGPQQAINDFLGRISQLSKHDQALTLGNLFGAEYSDNLAILVGGLDTYNKTLGLVSDSTKFQGSMLNEFNIKSATTANMLQLFKNHWDEILVSGGTIFLPKIVEWVGKFNARLAVGADTITRWSSLFPNITGLLGNAAIGIVGLIASLSALSIIAGAGSIVATGFGLAWAGIGLILTPLAPLLTALRMAWMVMKMEMLAGTGVFAALKIGLIAFATQLWTNISAIWAWNVALLSNPITWIVVGIAALIGIVAAAVIYWDTWTQAVISFSSKWLELIGVFALVDNAIAGWEVLKGWWQGFKNYLSSLNPFAVVGAGIDWLISKINMIPGVHIATGGADNPALSAIAGPKTSSSALSAMASQPQWLQQPAPGLLSDGFAPPQPVAPPASLSQSQTANVPKGGIMSQINNADNSKSVSVGGIYITNPPKPVTGQFLADELQMALG